MSGTLDSFLVHSLDQRRTMWFAHSFRSQIVPSDTEEGNVSEMMTSREQHAYIAQMVYHDYEIKRQQIPSGAAVNMAEYCNTVYMEGSFVINEEAISSEMLIVIWRRVLPNCAFTMVMPLTCNRLLASHILDRMATILAHREIDPKEFLLKPEEVFSILNQLAPNGKMLFTGTTGALFKHMNIFGLS